jgi:hypothetical protein
VILFPDFQTGHVIIVWQINVYVYKSYLYSGPKVTFLLHAPRAAGAHNMATILPASTLRNLTLRKSRALIGCCHIRKTPPAVHVIVRRFIPLVITMVTHALCLDAFWLVTCLVVSKIWIQLHWEWLACRNNHRLKGYPFAKIVLNELTKKRCLLTFLLEIWDCK